jgi:high-affinity iron transporter
VRALGVVALLAACATRPPPAEDVRRLAAALDVVATDYARAGPDRRLEAMLKDARSYAIHVPEAPDALREVTRLVSARAPADQVAAAARAERRRLLAAHGPIAVPVSPPARARAERLWIMVCAGCHGTGGVGDGPQGLFLSPEPRSFRDPEVMEHLSPLRAYSAITDGIPWTAMPSWGTFASEERWGLAFHVFALRHRADAVARGEAAWRRAGLPAPSPTRLAAMTDGELLALLRSRLDDRAASDALAWLRVEAAFAIVPSSLSGARREMAAALAANRAGRDDEAAAALARAADAFWRAAPRATRARLGRRVVVALREAEGLAAEGVLDEFVERSLRRAAALLDEAEER